MYRQFVNIISLTTLLIFQACSDSSIIVDQIKQSDNIVSLSGKVYLLSDSVNSDCTAIRAGTDFWPTFIFIDDSTFIKTINNCCMPSTISYYSGKYKLNADMLFLTYDSLQVVYTYPMEKDSVMGILNDIQDTVEIEKSDLQTEKLEHLVCSDKPYFRQTSGTWSGQPIALTTEAIEKYTSEIKDKQVWDKLMKLKH